VPSDGLRIFQKPYIICIFITVSARLHWCSFFSYIFTASLASVHRLRSSFSPSWYQAHICQTARHQTASITVWLTYMASGATNVAIEVLGNWQITGLGIPRLRHTTNRSRQGRKQRSPMETLQWLSLQNSRGSPRND
jgi:hypothetical protein